MLAQALSGAMFNVIPLMVAITTFTTYIALGNELDVSTALTSLALFELLRFPLFMLPNTINNIVEAKVSVDRVESFLLEAERILVPTNTSNCYLKSAGVAMRSATLVWDGIGRKKRVSAVKPQSASNAIFSLSNLKVLMYKGIAYLKSTVITRTSSSSTSTAEPAIIEQDKLESEYLKDIFLSQQIETEQLISKLESKLTNTSASESLNFDSHSEAMKVLEQDAHQMRSISLTSGVDSSNTGFEEKPAITLFRISVTAKLGEIIGIVGSVGSGKSSIVSGFLGEIRCFFGEVMLKGTIAYVGQRPYIQNCTLKDNILFGLPYDAEKYKKTLEECCLVPDLKVLPGGELTEIGERGINLSGGIISNV